MNSVLKSLGVIGAFAAAAVIGHGVAKASAAISTRLTAVRITGANYAIIFTEAAPTGTRPSCHSSSSAFTNAYAFDLSTAKGKALLASAQAAVLSGRTASVVGTNSSCTNTGSDQIETVEALGLAAN